MSWVECSLIASMSVGWVLSSESSFNSQFKSHEPLANTSKICMGSVSETKNKIVGHWPTSSSPLEEGHQRFGCACQSSRRCPHRGLWRTHLEKVWSACPFPILWQQFGNRQSEKCNKCNYVSSHVGSLRIHLGIQDEEYLTKCNKSFDSNKDLWHPQKK